MTKFINKLQEGLEKNKPKIVFPEGNNQNIIKAVELAKDYIEPILLTGDNALVEAAKMVSRKEADAMVAGIDCTTRDVILTTRDNIGMKGKTFSSCFVIELPNDKVYTLADCGVCINPSAEQLGDIVLQTVETHKQVSNEPPRVAMLSFSTKGSARDQSIDKINQTIELVKSAQPDLMIDGELQLDAAVNPRVGQKKAPDSSVAGKANILVVPDINSGNILYKSMEQFANGIAYGPILQGFNAPISDLSRGSTVEDVFGVAIITAVRINNSKGE